MDNLTENKPWYKSKTIRSAITILLLGIYNSAIPFVDTHYGVQLPIVPEWIYSLLAVLGIKYRMDAKTRIGK